MENEKNIAFALIEEVKHFIVFNDMTNSRYFKELFE